MDIPPWPKAGSITPASLLMFLARSIYRTAIRTVKVHIRAKGTLADKRGGDVFYKMVHFLYTMRKPFSRPFAAGNPRILGQ
jgi:hypothetical protein